VRRPSLLAALLVVALVCTLGGPLGAAEPYEINTILSLTGPGAFVGKNEQIALSLIESTVNKAGGIAGRPLKFTIVDDQSSPQVSVQLATGLIAKHVPLILGPGLIGNCNAVAPLAKDGPLLYCLSAAMHPEKDGYIFAYGAPTEDFILTNLRYFRLLGYTKLGFLITADAGGQDFERGLAAGLAQPENKGLIVVDREYYTIGDLSVVAQLTRIKASGAQAMIAWGTGTPVATVFHGYSDVGLTIPLGISSSNMVYPEMKQFSSFIPEQMSAPAPVCIGLDALPPGPLHDAVRDFVSAFHTIGIEPDVSQGIIWDPAWMLVGALRKLGPDATAARLRAYFANFHGWAGANGIYDFRGGNQRGLAGTRASVMVRWDAAKGTFAGISKLGGELR